MLLKNCNYVDVSEGVLIENVNILIKDGIIVSISKETIETDEKTIDCVNKYVTPGLIDAHVHLVWDGSADPQGVIDNISDEEITLKAYKHAIEYLNLGITTVRDVGSPGYTTLKVRDVINENYLEGPTIVSSGPPISMTGGHMHKMSREADGNLEVRKATREILKMNADLIKLMATGGIYTFGEEPGNTQLTYDEIKVAVEESKNKNKRVAAHADGLDGILNCINAGVNTIEHGIFADENALKLMCEKEVFLVPTMVVMRRLAEDKTIADWARKKALEITKPHMKMLKKAIKMGVKIATGTDCGSPVTPPNFYFDELLIMKEAGMSIAEVIKSSTLLGAECLNLNRKGQIKEGYDADLLILNKNPLEDLSVFKENKMVIRAGKLI